MSIINRMLQELENRHDEVQNRMPGMVRAVAPPRRTYRRLAGTLVMLVALGALVFVGYRAWQHRVPGASEIQQKVAAVVAPPRMQTAPPAVPATPPVESVGRSIDNGEKNLQFLPAPTDALVGRTAKAAAGPAQTVPPSVLVKAQPEPSVVKAPPQSGGDSSGAAIKHISPEQRADHRYREALALRNQGRVAAAQAALEEAIRIEPKHLGARQALLGMLIDGRQMAQAEQLLQEGLALNLAPVAQAMALARLQVDRRDEKSAVATLERHLPQAESSADYQAFLAALLQRSDRHSEAVKHYQLALRGQPNKAVWWMGLGISLQAEKRNADAAQAFERARQGAGLSPELHAFVEQRLKQLE